MRLAQPALETGAVVISLGAFGALANWLATPWMPCSPSPCQVN